MDITFWPHIWAIPLVLMLGFAIGWSLRSLVDSDLLDDRKPTQNHKLPKQDPETRAESTQNDPKAPPPR